MKATMFQVHSIAIQPQGRTTAVQLQIGEVALYAVAMPELWQPCTNVRLELMHHDMIARRAFVAKHSDVRVNFHERYTNVKVQRRMEMFIVFDHHQQIGLNMRQKPISVCGPSRIGFCADKLSV
jgi:hypothetical protein